MAKEKAQPDAEATPDEIEQGAPGPFDIEEPEMFPVENTSGPAGKNDDKGPDIHAGSPDLDDAGDDDAAEASSDETEDDTTDETALSGAMIDRALDAGLTEDQANALGVDALTGILDRLDQQAAELAKNVPDTEPATESETPKVEPYKLKLDPDLHEDDVVLAFNEMNEHYAGLMQTMSERLGRMEQTHTAAAEAERTTRMDRMFKDLGKEWEDVYGKGSTSKMSRRSDGYKARDEVEQHMKVLAAGYKAQGRQVPDEADLFMRAHRGTHGDKQATISQTRKAEKVRNRQGQFVARPSHRRTGSSTSSPTRNAAESVARKLSDIGFPVVDESVLEGIPK
jgi:hypothetical protein